MEIHRTQNSCSELFILQISPVFTEPWRIGVNSSAWQRKKRVWSHTKYNFWYLLRKWHLETVCKNTFWASKLCPQKFSSQGYVKTLGLNIVYQPGRCIKTRPENSWTTWTFSGNPIASQSRKDFSRYDYQRNDEVNDHKVELRPSTELLSAHLKSEGRESCVEESNIRNNETCALHVTSRYGNKEACGNNLSSPPSRSSLFKKTIVPMNEWKWVVIPANPSCREAFSISESKMVTRMLRHYDQEGWIISLEHRTAGVAEGVWKIRGTNFLRQISIGFSLFKKEAVRIELNTVWITKNPWLTFEQFKDTLVVFRWCRKWWDTRLFFTTGKGTSFTEVVRGAFNLSWGADWFSVEKKATKHGKLSSSHLWTLLVKIQMKKNPWWLCSSSESALSQSLET